ncbi:MAG: DUF86 domain-containing protein [Gallionella sp.]|nr:DUF86 domain-containing protein [Gallionella sp.]
MSEPTQGGNNGRDWRLYVGDMISFAEKVLAYTNGLNRQQFDVSGLTYDATMRNLELIGEAATRIPLTVRESAPNIQWRQIISMRNRLIHGYLGIDNDTLWSIIQDDVPSLLDGLLALKKAADENQIQ